MKIDWKRKLTSRKFWATIVTFVTGIVIFITHNADKANQIAGLIMSGASAIAYIIGEGLADAAGASSAANNGNAVNNETASGGTNRDEH